VCLRLPAYSASAKDICFIGTQPFDSCEAGISPNLEAFFRVSLIPKLSEKFGLPLGLVRMDVWPLMCHLSGLPI
ncbi:hypothetical protein, partial [Pseudomonas iridis]|uniref:hypothetical protein n=1 Tax=Pseudomonas iridis TaxID=2710587 RepID=UPI001B33ADB0